MKTNNISKSYKFFVAVIALVLICTVAFGASQAFAEPPLEDRVIKMGTGTFVPSELYSDALIERNDSEATIIAWLETTELVFSEKLWQDTDNNGVIEMENDIYKYESFLSDMLSRETGYPILDIGKDDFYVVPMVNYANFDEFVITQFQISKNNDNAELISKSSYWFDTENYILYIQKSLVDDNMRTDTEENVNIRAEIMQVVEDINTVTKSVGIFTVFDEDIENTYGLYSNTPNEIYHQLFKQWHLYGLEYILVQPEQLAYVDSDNLTVYVNGTEIDSDVWCYDESNGKMYVACDAYTTQDIIVKFNDVKNPNEEQVTLQALQSGQMGQAGANDLTELKKKMGNMKNLFVSNITFTEMPEVGDFDTCNSTASVRYNSNRVVGEVSGLGNALGTLCDTGRIKTESQRVLQTAGWSGDYAQGGTLALKNVSQYDVGMISYNLALAQYYKNDANKHAKYLQDALTATETFTTKHTDGFTSSWWVPGCGQVVYVAGRTGTLSDTFLGGTIDNATEGYAMFDMTCCDMKRPFSGAAGEGDFEGNDWIAQVTIVDVDTKSKELIVCAWSAAWYHTAGVHHQRILGFSRIPYTYDSDGYIQFSKKNEDGELLAGAVYDIKGVTDPTYLKRITTTDAQITIQLPIGDYLLEEVTPPKGYNKTSTSTQFTVTADHAEESTALQLSVTDEKQQVNGTLTVYDKPSVQNANGVKNNWVPVAGVQFDLKDSNGNTVQSNLTTDANGKITFSFDAINGNHYLIQTATITNYTQNDECAKKIPIKPSSGEWADTSGSDKTWSSDHFEPRQVAQIKSQVVDYDLDSKDIETPAVFSNSRSNDKVTGMVETDIGYVTTIGAKYELYTKSEIFLGYDSNKRPIKVPAGTKLTVCWDQTSVPSNWETSKPLTNNYKYQTYDNYQSSCSNQVVSFKDGDNAYVAAYTIRNPLDSNDKNLYPLPNGKYEWKLVAPSKGYALESSNTSSVSYQKSTTLIDADLVWEGPNTTKLTVSSVKKVIEVRQRVEINLFVKYYDAIQKTYDETYAEDVNATQWSIIQRKVSVVLNRNAMKDPTKSSYLDYLRDDIDKTMLTNSTDIDKNSDEQVIVYQDDSTILLVQTKGLVANSVYELVNLWPIFDIESGKAIDKFTPLGRYFVSDSNNEGALKITTLGSKGFYCDYLNQTIGDVQVKTADGTTLATGYLPNGVYMLKCLGAPANYDMELAAANSVLHDKTAWTPQNSNKEVISVNTTGLLEYEPTVNLVRPIVAPDPTSPITSSDNLPEQLELPSNPTEIPLVTIDWVNKNSQNIAYRITDTVNVTIENNKTIYDVQDKLPTTFSFYVNNPNIRDLSEEKDDWYTYEMAFYYEITQAEYNKAPASDKSDHIDITKTYIKLSNNVYAKKFEMNNSSAEDYLNRQIVLNPDSIGYNENYTTIKSHNSTISGALYNTSWLNNKLTQQSDHEFDIFVVTRATRHVLSIDYKEYTKKMDSIAYALRIKTRELINLD